MIKDKFPIKHGNCGENPRGYKLTEIKRQRPCVLSADCVAGNTGYEGKRCDQFVFCSSAPEWSGIYLVENKSGEIPASHAAEQLQGGADIVGAELERGEKFVFQPVVVGRLNASEHPRLLKQTISLGGKIKNIRHINPDSPLRKIHP